MKLLFIEDNAALVWRLQNYMDDQFIVQFAQTGSQGIEQAKSNQYDIIVLDLGLPDKSGDEVCQALRTAGLEMPILILTAESSTTSKVKLLEQGADDYLTKPFKLVELQARLRALDRRRGRPMRSPQLSAAGLTVDPQRRRVERDGKVIELRRKEFDILEYLVRNRGQVVTRPMILEHVWDGKNSWNNTVDVHIKYLRDKIDRPFERKLIKTAYGLGYMLDAN